ncbi:MAG: CHASE domain-containing protein [Deltaproteobacteria bacterium]
MSEIDPSRGRTPITAGAPSLKSGGRGFAVLAAGTVLAVMLGLTWLEWKAIGAAEVREKRAQLESQARVTEVRIAKRMTAYEELLRATAGFLGVSKQAGRAQFRDFVATLDFGMNYPGTRGIAFNLLIPTSDLARHTDAVRKEGFPDYAVHPVAGFSGQAPRPVGLRDFFTSIAFIEPFAGPNLWAFGYDTFSEPIRRAAMEKARDEGRPELTNRLTLFRETSEHAQTGVLMYCPVYRGGVAPKDVAERRERLIGWVSMAIGSGDFTEGALGGQGTDLDMWLYDGAEPKSAGLLFGPSGTLDVSAVPADRMEATRTLIVGGRPWTLVLRARPGFGAGVMHRFKPLVGLAGILLSLVLAAMVWVLATSRARALRLAGEMNQDRLTAEADLRRSEAEYRSLVENLNAGVVVHASDTRVLLCNAKACFLLGLSQDQILGKAAYDPGWRFVHEDGTTMAPEEFPATSVVTSGKPVVNLVVGIHRPATSDLVWVLVSATPVFGEAGQFMQVVVTFIDITRRKEAEEALRKTQLQLVSASRLAAMGTLVGGIAHQVNNPLAGTLSGQALALEDIRTVCGLLQGGAAFDRESAVRILNETAAILEDAQTGAQRVASVVKDMSTYGRPDPRRSRAQLIDVVQDAIRWLPAPVASEVTLHVEDHGAPDVLASPGQIRQVLENLVTNATKAIPRGRVGRIHISCGTCRDGMACIEVTDDGSGMSPETVAQVFDPFFTTRSVGEGRGTGLGLSVCHAIVTAHGGTLSVVSQLGKGSTFRVELPSWC